MTLYTPDHLKNLTETQRALWSRTFAVACTAFGPETAKAIADRACRRKATKPYTSGREAPGYVPAGNRAQWSAVWNSVYKETGDEGRAFQIANGVAGKRIKAMGVKANTLQELQRFYQGVRMFASRGLTSPNELSVLRGSWLQVARLLPDSNRKRSITFMLNSDDQFIGGLSKMFYRELLAELKDLMREVMKRNMAGRSVTKATDNRRLLMDVAHLFGIAKVYMQMARQGPIRPGEQPKRERSFLGEWRSFQREYPAFVKESSAYARRISNLLAEDAVDPVAYWRGIAAELYRLMSFAQGYTGKAHRRRR